MCTCFVNFPKCFLSHYSFKQHAFVPKIPGFIHSRNAVLLMTAFGSSFLIMYENKEILFCSSAPLRRIVTDCVKSDTTPLKDCNSTDRHCVSSQDTDASVTETRINWTRWKRVLNFKPLSCTSKAPSSNPVHKVITDIVFSLCMKNVRIGFSLSRGVLDWKVITMFYMNFTRFVLVWPV